MTISLIFLFVYYILNIIFLLNKDIIKKNYLKKKINNSFLQTLIIYYFNYQFFMIKLSLNFTPILIFIGLFILCKGFHFLITHQIPLEILGVNLNTIIITISK